MTDLNLGRLISKYVNYRATNAPKQPTPQQTVQNNSPAQTFSATTQNSLSQNISMVNIDQSAYVKDVLKLPKNLNELVFILQKNITLAQFNQRFTAQVNAQRNAISQTQAQILAQLQGLSLTEAQNMIITGNKTLMNQMAANIKNLPINANGMINLLDISAMIQSNGKDAITKLITTMASSAKLGVTDLAQLKETAKLVNASIATAAQNDSAQTMKLLMLLYLPWLPLQEGVGFDLEIEQGANPDGSDSILTITITTINYGNVIATLILENSNSVHVNIECNKDFPKEELLIRIENDKKHYSMDSVVSFDSSLQTKPQETQEKPEAKINMSATSEINPYLLLMSHTIIRHVIEIDKNTSNGIESHID